MKKVYSTSFGELKNQLITQFTMENKNGMRVSSCTLGAIITEIIVPDTEDNFENVVCSFDRAEQYLEHPHFFGAAIGRFAGRLENSEVYLNGQTIQLTPNEGAHLLHGGACGFHNQIWQVESGELENGVFTKYHVTNEGEFPGKLQMTITYTLTDENELIISYDGICDEDTVLNCTNHSYFNLSGDLKETIHNHSLRFAASEMLPINEQGLPLGEASPIRDTIFDFNEAKPIGDVIGKNDAQVQLASGGIDHPFILQGTTIELTEPKSGRVLTIVTDDKALVVYTGSKIGHGYRFREAPARDFLGICLEVQNVPNSMKYKHFPSAIIKKNERYTKQTVYQFSVK